MKNHICENDIIHSDIVALVSSEMPDSGSVLKLSDLFKSFADATRVKILFALSISEMCVCDLAALFEVTRSAVSHQLKALRLANLVKFRKEGKVVYYSLSDDHVKTMMAQGFEHINEK